MHRSNSMTKISVVLTTKNEEKNIKVLLESLINQEEPYEVLVVDSDSTDKTQEIVKNYSNKNIICRQKYGVNYG